MMVRLEARSEIGERFGGTHKQIAARRQPVGQAMKDAVARGRREIDHHVAAKNDVERSSAWRLRCAGKPSADNSIAVADAAPLEVGFDERDRAWIAFHKRHVRGAA